MKKQINIEGMSCGHCTARVEKSLREVAGVSNVTVSLNQKNAVVELNSDVTDAKLKEAVEDAGYEVTSITSL